MFKWIFSLFLIIFNFSLISSALALDAYSSSTVTATLPKVISIDSVYVDGQKISSAIKEPFLEVREVQKIDDNQNLLELSSIRYKIKANTKNNIKVNADFVSLEGQEYYFSREKLSIKENLSDTTKMSPEFIPQIKVDSEVPPGFYNGVILVTISSL